MKTATPKASDHRVATASIAGCVEGYLALVLIALSFLGPRIDHPSDAMVIGSAVYTSIAFGFALGGVRFGKGGGRLAALVALVVLSLWLLVVLAVSIVRWEQVLWHWRHYPEAPHHRYNGPGHAGAL